MKKVIAFLRVSTIQQQLEGQREKVISNIIADGYKESEIFVIEGKESAIKLDEEERQTLNQLKDAITHYPDIKAVYVFAIDRLARRVSIVLSIKDYLLKRGINLIFLNPHKMGTMREENGVMVEDELTSMMLMFLSYGAEMEIVTGIITIIPREVFRIYTNAKVMNEGRLKLRKDIPDEGK